MNWSISLMEVKNYIYIRGQENFEWKLESSWIRMQTKDLQGIEENQHKEELRKHIWIFNEHINNIRKNNMYKNKDILDILAELQHSKDVPTPLIDFTDDILAAFIFALSNHNYKTDAAIFIIETTHEEIRNNLKEINNNTREGIFESPFVSTRSISQRSYFIIDSKDWEINEKNIIKIKISALVIEKIQKYLRNKNKTFKSVYPDLKGEYLNVTSTSSMWYFLKGHSTTGNESIDNYTKVIELNPTFMEAYNNRGTEHNIMANIYIEKGDLSSAKIEVENAMDDFFKSLKLNSNNTLAHMNIGISHAYLKKIYEQEGKLVEAKLELEKAWKHQNESIKIDPNNVLAYINMGIMSEEMGNSCALNNEFNEAKIIFEESIKYYDKAIIINPKNDRLYNDKGYLYYKISEINIINEKYSEAKITLNHALKYYNQALKINPNNTMALKRKSLISEKLASLPK